MFGLTARATIRVAGRAGVLVATVIVLCIIASLKIEPWLKVVFAAFLMPLIIPGGIWIFSGGEEGMNVDVTDGQRRVSVTNAHIFAGPIARAVLSALKPAPLPLPVGTVMIDGNPADPKYVVEGPASLPASIETTQAPIDVPPDAGRLL